jgi:hypothetical protein
LVRTGNSGTGKKYVWVVFMVLRATAAHVSLATFFQTSAERGNTSQFYDARTP